MLPQYEFHMTVIAPYKGLDARVFRQAAKNLRCRLRFADLAFEDAIDAAKRLSPDTCDIVLSRGITVDVIKQHSTIPVVPIDISAGRPAGAPALCGKCPATSSFSAMGRRCRDLPASAGRSE